MSDIDVHIYLDSTNELDVGIVDDTAVISNQAFELVFSREALAVLVPRLTESWRQIKDKDAGEGAAVTSLVEVMG